MKRKKYSILIVLIGILLEFLIISPIIQGTAKIVWSEDFTTADEWKLQGFDLISVTLDCVMNQNFAPTIENGILKMPNTQDKWNYSQAVHSSAIAYGTWSFDWLISIGSDHQAYDVVCFIANNYGPTEESGEIPKNFTGYVLVLTSDEKREDSLKPHAVTLAEFIETSKYWVILNYFQFPKALEGLFHIDITRNIAGEFNIYINSEHVFKVVDNSTTTSENFIFGSWFGDTVFDNLTVSNTVDIHPPTGANYPSLFISVVPIGLLIILKKKHKK
ncbi:MAG: hypothetical protein ACFFAM_15285 [Promethearchaeota archaeon]